MKIVVTGGSGKAGRATVEELLAHGHAVTVVDRVRPVDLRSKFLIVDLTQYGEAVDAFNGCDAVVHLAAIPAPRIFPDPVTFKNNTISDYNVFQAARQLGIRNVVWASSETVLGLPFDSPPPYVPLDEDYDALPESAYSLAKLVTETVAKQFCRWDPSMKIFGLRFSNIMEPQDYEQFSSFEADIEMRRWNLWSYIDARDAAQAVRLAVESPLLGAEVFVIANSDSVMSHPSMELMAERYPEVPFKSEVTGTDSLMSSAKAKRILGFEPKFGWR